MNHIWKSAKRYDLPVALILFGAFVLYKAVTYQKPINQEYLYFLDAGHGGGYGKCGFKSVLEEDGTCFWEYKFNFAVRQALMRKLDSARIKYILVNPDSTPDMDLNKRVEFINKYKTNLKKVSISIHANAASKKSKDIEAAHGIEIFVSETLKSNLVHTDKLEKTDSFATYMADFYYIMFKQDSPYHQVRHKPFIKKDLHMTFMVDGYAILTENDFFTNSRARAQMKNQDYIEKIAHVHFQLIDKIEKMAKEK